MHLAECQHCSAQGLLNIALAGTSTAPTNGRLVAKNLVLGGNLTVKSSVKPTTGIVLTLLENTGTSVAGQFANMAEGSTLLVNGVTYRLSYQGNDGNDVTLTAL